MVPIGGCFVFETGGEVVVWGVDSCGILCSISGWKAGCGITSCGCSASRGGTAVDDASTFFSPLFSAVTLKEFDLDILPGLLSAWVLASGAPITTLRPRDLDRPRDFERDRELCTRAEKKDDLLG